MESTDTKERENASMINVVVIIAITYRRVAGDTLLKVQGETVRCLKPPVDLTREEIPIDRRRQWQISQLTHDFRVSYDLKSIFVPNFAYYGIGSMI